MRCVIRNQKIRKIFLALAAVVAVCGLIVSQCAPSYAAGINYDDLASLSGDRFSADGLRLFVQDLKNEYVPTALANITETFSSLTPTVDNLQMGLDFINNTLPNSALALTTSNGVSYKLTINLAKLTATADKKVKTTDLFFTTINHELMHAVMFDVTTNGMLGKRDWNTTPVTELIDEFPRWFYEGIAQAVGGGAEHSAELVHDFYYRLPLERREAATKAWLSRFYWLGYEAYAQGYIATLYLGFLAGDGQSLTAENIANGLNLVLQDLSDGYSFGETINRKTRGKYADIEDMKAKFADDAYQFSIDYVEAIDTDDPGAGSVASTGGLKAKASVLHSGRHTKSNFFTLDITKLGAVDNSGLLNSMTIATGGGNTKTERIKRNGQLNEDASEVWPAPVGVSYPYVVEHYVEGAAGVYVLDSSEQLTAVYGTTVQAATKSLTGFTLDNTHANTVLSKVIKGRGQKLRVYYKKQTTPSTPTEPAQPSQPAGPTQPTSPTSSVRPTSQSTITGSAQVSSSANETLATETTNPTNPTNQTETDSIDKTTQSTPKMRTTDPMPEAKTTQSTQSPRSTKLAGWWWFAIAGVILAAAIVLIFVKLKK